MHPALIKIQCAIEGTPFDGDVFLVGGAVRDELLGLIGSDDFDLVTRESAPSLARFLFDQGIATFAPVTFERFGTAMVEVDGIKIELVTARKESYDKKSRKPSVEPGTYEDDARRRDFTLNTLMRSLKTGELIDPLGCGVEDLNNKVMRTPLDPVKTFDDDPLRMLRAVRFRWRFGLSPAKGLYDAIYMRRNRLKIVSFERIRDELFKILAHPTTSQALQDLMKLKVFDLIAPEFIPMVGCEQGDYHHLDVWHHTLKVIDNLHEKGSTDLALILSALFHDIGKPTTQSLENGKIRFFGHEAVGAEMARTVLNRWKLPGDQVDTVVSLVKNHMRLGSAPTFSDSAARRLLKDLGEDVPRLLDLVDADANALKKGVRVLDLQTIRETIERVETETPVAKLISPLTGQEIMELTGLTQGKEIGRLKKMLDNMVVEGQLGPDDKELARKLVQDNVG